LVSKNLKVFDKNVIFADAGRHLTPLTIYNTVKVTLLNGDYREKTHE